MRNAIILLILAVVFFAAGWTIYRFVTKRSAEVQNSLNKAPALQQAPTATPSAVAVKTTPTPTATPAATVVPTAKPVTSSKNLPTTGPATSTLAALGGVGVAALVGVRQYRAQSAVKKAYRAK